MAVDPFGPIIFTVATILAACVRAAETALPYLDESEWEKEAEHGDAGSGRMLQLAGMASEEVNLLQSAHLMLLLAACVCGCVWLQTPLHAWLSEGKDTVSGFLTGLILFVPIALLEYCFGVRVPERWAASRPEKVAKVTVWIAVPMAWVLSPVAKLCAKAMDALLKLFHIEPGKAQEHVTEEEIRMMVDIGEEKGTIESDEKEMIQNIFEFSNLTAEDCMIHRKDVTAIDVEDDSEEILKTIRESGLSRFPVYENDIDNVIGILTSREYLLNACADGGKSIRDMLRPAYFAPASMKTDVLFREMQSHKQHMAIVVDEYGGTGGLVTMEDLLEEIVGNIYDEFDPQAEQDITALPDGRYRVSGSAELETLSETLGIELPEDTEWDTLGGLVFGCLQEIPADGEKPVVEQYGLRVSVEKIEDRRVEWAVVEKLPRTDPEEE